jgi:hypothetical protein
MSIEIIGAGFGRTGTLSVKLALEQLGISECYHMRSLFAHAGHAEAWTAMAKGDSPDWPSLFRGYRAAVDWPVAYFWRELVDYYPQAKVLLTVRDAADWYKSMTKTIFTAIDMAFPEGATTARVPEDTDPLQVAQIICAKEVISEATFQGRGQDRQYCIYAYEKHNAEVKRVVPADRLLVCEVKQGWTPICDFLGMPVPDEPFPNSNAAEEFHSSTSKGE